VTGGGGFIGTHLIRGLLNEGAGVDLIGPPPLKAQAQGLIGPGKATYWPDAVNGGPSNLRDLLRRCDSVIHLEYHYPKSSGFWPRLQDEVNGNLVPTVELLDCAEQAGVQFLCFASSASVYPRTLRFANEDGPVDPAGSPYAFVKLAQESCVRRWGETFGRSASILRLATVYGPGETVGRAIPNFIRAVLAGTPPVVEGRGSESFDVIFVADVVDAFVLALQRRRNDTFNIGTGFGRTPRELAGMVIRLTEAPLEIVENHAVPERHSPVCVVTKATTQLGFRARTPLETGLREEIRWFAGERTLTPDLAVPPAVGLASGTIG
jgi:UDP-glucose 4-epimerase